MQISLRKPIRRRNSCISSEASQVSQFTCRQQLLGSSGGAENLLLGCELVNINKNRLALSHLGGETRHCERRLRRSFNSAENVPIMNGGSPLRRKRDAGDSREISYNIAGRQARQAGSERAANHFHLRRIRNKNYDRQ
jgi:hypothetical protein